MKLSKRTLSSLAEMICGSHGTSDAFSWNNFPYRSSSYLTQFFYNCELEYEHNGYTRKLWVQDVLEELNDIPASNPHLPTYEIVRVIQELLAADDFQKNNLDRSAAVQDVNSVLGRDGLAIYLDENGQAHIRNTGTKVTSFGIQFPRRAWTDEEIDRRNDFVYFLDNASEDEFIEQLLHPLLRQLGFIRVSVTGHKDKRLEFGKDLWWKFQLPTMHFIYFGAQVKLGKLDAAGKSKNINISEVLNQVRMMLDHPIWDPETNKQNLLDHVFIISAGDITKQAKDWLARHLDKESRRHILFMDRDEILDLAVNTNLKLPKSVIQEEDEIPF